MGKFWSEENIFNMWLMVELAILWAKEKLGLIPAGIYEKTLAAAKFTIERIREIEKTTDHDLMAFVNAVAENLPDECKPYFHGGVTSFDDEDTALALLMVQSLDVIIAGMRELMKAVYAKAQEHKYTLEIGRTHGVHAEPITFGLKLIRWYDELSRQLKRLLRLKYEVGVGKISGAVGTYANIPPAVEKLACEHLGLRSAKVSSQIIPRDIHATFVTTLAIMAGSLGNFAKEIRDLARTDTGEVQEKFKKGQKGSSAMPHKRNPIKSENVCSLARLMRGFVVTAMENQETTHERDLANSANERIIIADSATLLDFMIARFTAVVEGLVVNKDRMRENINYAGGVVFSEDVMLALAGKGMPREEAHTVVQELALKAMEEGLQFSGFVYADARVTKLLKVEEIEACFDPRRHIKYVDEIFARFQPLEDKVA
jgi:adenylosuccinate lyase